MVKTGRETHKKNLNNIENEDHPKKTKQRKKKEWMIEEILEMMNWG